MLDIVIRGGLVVDGTGTPGRVLDVGIRDGVIVAIGAVDEDARESLDATGLVEALRDGTVSVPEVVDAAIARTERVDADLGANTMGWQWAGGCGADAAPYFRVFNPVLQGEKFDPAGDYVRRYVPELAGSAFADVRVRDVMDMTTCLRYSEDYADPEAEIWEYAKASNPLPQPDAEVVGTAAYLRTLQSEPGCRVGEAFAYKTPNADVLGWIVARASGKSVAALLSERTLRLNGLIGSPQHPAIDLCNQRL